MPYYRQTKGITSNYIVWCKRQGYRPPSEHEVGLLRKPPRKTTTVPPDCGPWYGVNQEGTGTISGL